MSGRCPGRPRGSAARSWCTTPGPAGRPARCTPSTACPLSATREGGQACLLVGFYPARTLGRAGGSQHPGVVSPGPRTRVHGLSHVLGAEQPQGLHGLEAAAGSGTGEVVEAGAAGGRPARDGGPRPPAAFTFLRETGVQGGSALLQGSQTEPLPSLLIPSGCAHL